MLQQYSIIRRIGLLFLFTLPILAFSQSYQLTSSSGIFVPIIGGTAVSSINVDDAISDAINIGFGFVFNGVNYNQIKASSNGFISFNISASSDNSNSLTSASKSSRPLIAPLWDDLGGDIGSASYKIEGTSPNSIFTFEWLNWKWSYYSSSTVISFQVKLYETSNRIEFIYKQESGSPAGPSASVGLAFPSSGFCSLNNTSSSPTLSALTEVSSISERPATGQIYQFDFVIKPEPTNYATGLIGVQNDNSINLNWTDATGATLPDGYLILASKTNNFTDPVDFIDVSNDLNLSDGTGIAKVVQGAQTFNGFTNIQYNNIYYFKLYSYTNAGTNINYKTVATVPNTSVNFILNPEPTNHLTDFTAISGGSTITLNWTDATGSTIPSKYLILASSSNNITDPTDGVELELDSYLGDGNGAAVIQKGIQTASPFYGFKSVTTYYFKIYGFTNSGSFIDYKTTNVVPSTSLLYITPEPTEHVTDFTASIYEEQIALTWTDTYSSDGFVIMASETNSFTDPVDLNDIANDPNLSDGIGMVKVNKGVQKYIGFTNLQSPKTYYFKIYPYTNSGTFIDYRTSATVPQTSILFTNPGPSRQATNFKASINNSIINLNWVDALGDILPEGYLIMASNTNSFTNPVNGVDLTPDNNLDDGIGVVKVNQGFQTYADWLNSNSSDTWHFRIYSFINSGASIEYKTNTKIPQTVVSFTKLFVEQSLAEITTNYTHFIVGDYNTDGFLDALSNGANSNIKLNLNIGGNDFAAQAPIVYGDGATINTVDYDNDSYLDFSLTADFFGTKTSKIYRNNGDNTFTDQSGIALIGGSENAAAWGDYDNDGDQDLVVSAWTGGYSNVDPLTKLYRNNGNNSFTEVTNVKLRNVWDGSFAWADFDNDGDLDLLLTGNPSDYNYSTSDYTRIYRNDGNEVFTELKSTGLDNIRNNSVDIGDYDNDGDLDIILSGSVGYSGTLTKVYRNNGNNSFTGQTDIVFADGVGGTAMWADIDNDEFIDIVLAGNIYRNNGNNTFTELAEKVGNGSFGDFNNDGKLDIIASNAKIFVNSNINVSNKPNIPDGLTAVVTDTALILKWNRVQSNSTPAKGFSYNIRIGTSSGAINIVSPSANTSGKRYLSGLGNTQLDTFYILRKLEHTSYYWSVQAVNSSFDASSFAPEQSINYNIDMSATNLLASNNLGKQIDFRWKRGNGSGSIVFCKKGNSGAVTPIDDVAYTANSKFGLGSELDGWFCVYKGEASNTTITGLDIDTEYIFQVIEFENPRPKYYSTKPSAILAIKTPNVAEVANLPDFSSSSQSWGDFDNDGDLDFIITGYYMSSGVVTRFFRNDGSDHFTEISSHGIGNFSDASIALGDYDNDGLLDVLISGNNNGVGLVTQIYHNNGNFNFSDVSNLNFIGVSGGSVSWADLDNDGDLDVVINGNNYSLGAFSKIYKNNRNNQFSEAPVILPGIESGNIACGDYDNDGYIDLLMVGSGVSVLYHNNGNFSFTEQPNFKLPEFESGIALWGDEDNDGFLDIFISGQIRSDFKSNPKTAIYRNNQNGTFTKTIQKFESDTTISATSAVWIDLNSDGFIDLVYAGGSGNQPSGDGYTTDPGGNHIYLYYNNGDQTYTKLTNYGIPALGNCSLSAGDYDNNGNIGLLYSGRYGNPCYSDGHCEVFNYTKLYNFKSIAVKIKPSKPEGLESINDISKVIFKWNRVKTNGNLDKSLTYNLRIGKTKNGVDIKSDMSSEIGFRRIADFGNCFFDTTFTVNNLIPGKYYWSVQAINNSFIGGLVATDSIEILPIQASNLQGQSLSDPGSLRLTWKNGNGLQRIVFCKKGTSGFATPASNTSYFADNKFEDGDQIGTTGWFCVYNGRAESAIISGLLPGDEYMFEVMEYIGTNGQQIYNQDHSGTNLGNFSAGSFTAVTNLNISSDDNAKWIDIDGNGYLDIATAWAISFNMGNNSFIVRQRQALNPESAYGINGMMTAFADFNNDNLIDIYDGRTIYLNDNDKTFSRSDTLISTYNDMHSFGMDMYNDINNDGNIDIISTKTVPYFFTDHSSTTDSTIVVVFYGYGNGTFSSQTKVAEYKGDYSIKVADFNNDGVSDLFLTGYKLIQVFIPDSLIITQVYGGDEYKFYKNELGKMAMLLIYPDGTMYTQEDDTRILVGNGTGSFTDKYQYGFGISNYGNGGTLTTIDYNNDGNLDLIVSYRGENFIYRNNGDCNLEKLVVSSFPAGDFNSQDWGDFDNDGLLDLLVTGADTTEKNFTKVYHNNGDNTFTEVKDVPFTTLPYSWGNAIWGDYDNDGDLDFLLTDNNGGIEKIYRNNTKMVSGIIYSNTKPSAPKTNPIVVLANGIKFSWEPSSTNDETPSNSLSYNLRVKEINSTNWLGSPMSSDLGKRMVGGMGNMQLNKSVVLNLKPGTYEWQVQAIDGGYMGGDWSSTSTFTKKNTQAFFTSSKECLGTATVFTNLSEASDTIESVKWYFGDNTTSNIFNPTHLYQEGKIYLASLVITDKKGVTDSISFPVEVKPNTKAGLTTTNVCFGNVTTFTNTTLLRGATAASWHWDYGNGETSTGQVPQNKTFLIADTLSVKLTVTATNGCTSDSTISAIVTPTPNANINISSGSKFKFCKNSSDSAYLSVSLQPNCTYQWLNSNIPLNGKISNYLTVKESSGLYTVKVTQEIGGCSVTSSTPVEIIVNDSPSVPSILQDGSPTTFCAGESLELQTPSNQNLNYLWKRNGGLVGQSNQYTVTQSGKYSLTVANSITLCEAHSIDSVTVIVNPRPNVPSVSYGETNICEGSSVIFSVINNPELSYQWFRDNEIILGKTSNQCIADTTGAYLLEINNNKLCSVRTSSVSVTVNKMPSKPIIDNASSYQPFCPDTEIELKVKDSKDLVNYQWKRSGVNIEGATMATFVGKLSSGDYKVEAKIGNCASESDPLTLTTKPAPAKPKIFVRGPNLWILTCDNKIAKSYEWYYNNSLKPDVKSYQYIARQELGDYYVKIKEDGECWSSSDIVKIPTVQTGIDDLVNEVVSVYPNPTQGVFKVDLNSNLSGIINVQILDALGKTISEYQFMNTSEFSIDISGLQNGVYLCKINHKNIEVIKKIVKQ
ncbi:MAG: FG-GAP-like repeat-containing protein [Tenuifilaceae bacterium]